MRGWLGLAAIGLALAPAAAAAKVLVVKAMGPSARAFPTGKQLGDSAKFTLKAGDRLSILDARGTRTFVGPARIDLARTPPTDTRVAILVARRNQPADSLGGLRGRAPTKPEIAMSPVMLALGGRQCVLADTRVIAHRTRSDGAASYILSDPANGANAAIDFAADQAEKPWPAEALPVANAKRYTVGGAGAGGAIEFAVLPGKAEDNVAWAALLIKNGCAAQVEAVAAL